MRLPAIPNTIPPQVIRSLRNFNGGPGWWQTIQAPEPASLPWTRMQHVGNEDAGDGLRYEIWENDRYTCSVRRFVKGWFIKNKSYIVIGISNMDESARHD